MQWISIDDRLPEPYKFVLVFVKYLSLNDLKIANHYGLDEIYWVDDHGYSCIGVTHWMPLPEAL